MNSNNQLIKPIIRFYYSGASNHCRNLAREIEESRYSKIVSYISVDQDPKTMRIPKLPSFVTGVPTIYARNNKGEEIVLTGKSKCSNFITAGNNASVSSSKNPNLDSTGIMTFSEQEMSAFDTSYSSVDGNSMNQNLNPFNNYQQIYTPPDDGQKVSGNVDLNYRAPEIRRSGQVPNFQDQTQSYFPSGTGGNIDNRKYDSSQYAPQRPTQEPNFQDPVQNVRGNPDIGNSFEAMMAQRSRDDELLKR